MADGVPVTRKWWALGFVVTLVLGAALRLVWIEDMEYKYDECWTFWQTQGLYGQKDSPWLGLYTSTGVRNPGMSVWVFIALAKLVHATEPTDLARAVQITNILALGLLTWFALRVVPREQREPWLWAIALAAVNPLTVGFHRKIWAPSVLPLLMVIVLIGWWYRERRSGAFVWAALMVVMGQIHPSGFFLALAFFLWAVLFDRRRVAWTGWFTGSAIGALPMLPWFYYLLTNSPVSSPHRTLMHVAEGKFWIRWVTEPFGLGLDYSLFEDFPRFMKYPLVAGVPTYLVGLLHGLVVALMVFVLGRTLHLLWVERSRLLERWIGRSSDTAFTQSAALWGFGLLLTLSCLPLYRHYMIILFPLEFLWAARLTLAAPSPADGAEPPVFRPGRVLLAGLVAVQFLITVNFLGYIHTTGGSTSGDYGIVYHLDQKYRTTTPNWFFSPRPWLHMARK
jgi:hypothetical protein